MDISFDKRMLAYCGIYCEQCSFKLAHDECDISHLKSLPFTFELKDVSAYACDGCKGSNCICISCKIKPCLVDKGLDSCTKCDSFSLCKILSDFENDGMPHHKAAIENLRLIKKHGEKIWFKSFRKGLTCKICGKRQSWYHSCVKDKKKVK